jgi:4-hydroxy-3-methylbut-2-enyl diphosphate reductase
LASKADVVLVLGSQNSSNSQRLRELGVEQGKKSYLIDGPEGIDAAWFRGDEKVLITAGASAPESVVQNTIAYLQDKFNATMEEVVIRREEVHFPLPKALREFAKDAAN